MKKQHIITLALMALGLVGVAVTTATADEAKKEAYAFGIMPEKAAAVAFDSTRDPLHRFHVSKLKEAGLKCDSCHNKGDFKNFLDAGTMKKEGASQEELTSYVHENCTSCHIEMNAGPLITSCRSCHAE